VTNLEQVFENQPKFLTPKALVALGMVARDTVYDWHYRPDKYGVPEGMFLKNGRKLLIRTDMFKKWFISRCA
jgi:hypothetical protein